ncbi:MAG: DUF4349 domain-containing protein [Candidatus Diapherotrites archaeon]
MNEEKFILVALISLSLIISGCLSSMEDGGDYGGGDNYSGDALYAAEKAPSPNMSISDRIATGENITIKRGTADIETGLGRLDEGLGKLKGLIAQNNGTIENISYRETESRKSYSIEVKIPPSKFEEIANGLKTVGTLKSLSTNSEDVTFEYIDLEAEINNLNAQKTRLLEIYNKANSVEDIIKIEKEINRVQTQIDSATARMKFLERQVERATLNITLYEEAPIVDQSLIVPINQAINTLIGAMGFSILLISGLIGFFIPFIVIVAAIILVLGIIKRIFFKNMKIPFIGKKK